MITSASSPEVFGVLDGAGIRKWLRTLPSGIAPWIEKYIRVEQYKEGDLIAEEKAPPTEIFIINKGVVKLTRTKADGRWQILHFAGPGDILGLSSLATDNPRPYNLVAHTSSETGVLSKTVVQAAIEKEPTLYLHLMQKLNGLINDLDQQRAWMLPGATQKNLVQIVLNLKKKFGTEKNGWIRLNLPATDLANYMGVSRTHLYYILGRQKEAVEYRNGFLRLK